jgi:hypothetical protein
VPSRRATLIVAVAALVACGNVSGHLGGGRSKGYVSTIAGVEPNVVGILVAVVGGDNQLRLSNYSGKTLVILGYQGEPYLRFDRTGVYVNVRSPARYLSRGHEPVPGSARADAVPRWQRVATGVSFTWHDNRIHWVSATPPPSVRRAPEQLHRLFDWKVPGRANSTPFAITGFLGYVPPPGRQGDEGREWALPAALAGAGGAVLATLAFLLIRRQRGARRH